MCVCNKVCVPKFSLIQQSSNCGTAVLRKFPRCMVLTVLVPFKQISQIYSGQLYPPEVRVCSGDGQQKQLLGTGLQGDWPAALNSKHEAGSVHNTGSSPQAIV